MRSWAFQDVKRPFNMGSEKCSYSICSHHKHTHKNKLLSTTGHEIKCRKRYVPTRRGKMDKDIERETERGEREQALVQPLGNFLIIDWLMSKWIQKAKQPCMWCATIRHSPLVCISPQRRSFLQFRTQMKKLTQQCGHSLLLSSRPYHATGLSPKSSILILFSSLSINDQDYNMHNHPLDGNHAMCCYSEKAK